MWWSGCTNCVWILLRDLRCQTICWWGELATRVSTVSAAPDQTGLVPSWRLRFPSPSQLPFPLDSVLACWPVLPAPPRPRFLLRLPSPQALGSWNIFSQGSSLGWRPSPSSRPGLLHSSALAGLLASTFPLLSCPRGDCCCCLMYTSSSPALCCASVSLLSFTRSPGFPQTTPHPTPHPQPPESHRVHAPCQSPRPLGTSVADHLHPRQDLCLTFLLPLSAPSA